MFAKRLLAVAVPALLAATPTHAGVSLIGIGQLAGSDLSGLGGTLENGAPANTLGGLGSAIAWAGGDTFYVTPDRGPNASSWNAAVDETTSWVPRYQTVSLGLASATALAAEGCRVAICARGESALQEAAASLRAVAGADDRILPVVADVSSADALDRKSVV